ncbi:MAG TPA: alpha-hydroxy acid oxidase [Gemmatimonadaceae bacterium]|nr:alpha-hydroxy acid oxidase [Gemmatimonadaceae bacterium]
MLNNAVCLTELEPLAKKVMTPMAFEYVSGGAGDERTLAWNTEAFARLRLRPRVLTDVSALDTRVTLFGDALPLPLLLAPAAYHRLFHPDGELATARGAANVGVPYCVSTCTTTPLEEIASAAPGGVRWLQIYITADRGRTRDLLQAAEATGVRALCLTVDTPVAGTRNREQRTGFNLPPTCVTPYLRHAASAESPGTPFVAITWRDVEWLRAQTRLPVLLKGILTGDDAARGVENGAAGIVVSNHGARNLDTVPASIDALPEVAAAVGGRVPVLLDGGIRRGTDIVKAIALGAAAVMIGRPYLYGLALGGTEGVEQVVRILRAELESALSLLGRPSVANVDRTIFW